MNFAGQREAAPGGLKPAYPIIHHSSFRAAGPYSRDRMEWGEKCLPDSSARVQVPNSWGEAERQGGGEYSSPYNLLVRISLFPYTMASTVRRYQKRI